ncbi:MAG: bifunctional diaminohydroxyphosphoribosylaminopyrimidine deaminase/5-amino-6-(5-phosphoribosylamino)uracil reductase RibD [Paludibacteraceae bacterium]|nr:bifunctional diaminohydroxyphosphoribosylaminopyrimidine deaminase/5-amino-6-(5-phosphoribosylamino)uracil reductase RibD [Paludibacteraceae bacterium]
MLEYTKYISRCLQLARLGEYYVAPNPMVGAVLVYSGEGVNGLMGERIIGEGWHKEYGGPHAEVNCFASVRAEDEELLKDSTLFVSLEPCSHFGKTPPCADLIVRKGVKRVVVGMLDPNPQVAGQGIARLRENGIEVVVGILEAGCRELNKRFLCLHEKHRPYVILKWAQTADGFMDRKRPIPSQGQLTETRPLVISTPLSKRLVHKMRAENMAILVGSNTALLDNPKLKNTHWVGRNPIRVLLDRRKRVPLSSAIFSDDAQTIVYSENTEWSFVLEDLAKRGIHSILVEGGAQVLNHILETGIYDEIHVETGEICIGDGVLAPKISK